jgi:SpoVK/Ycf46/Vps4 family AAA+-type ATPase
LTPRETAALKVIEDQFRSKQAPATDDAPLVLSSDVTADASSVCGPPERPEPTDVPPGPPQPTGEQTHAEAAFRLWEVKPLQLDSFVGQRSVTQAIRNWLDWGRFQSKRREAGVPYKTPDLHFVFVGRAGTGKSQVAQIVARSLRNNGFLKHGDLVEADGFDLISGQPHEAIEAMKAKIKEAMGGMLLFDHAAVLLTSEDESGTAALRVLKKNLVAHANHFAVVLTSHSGCLLSLIDADPDLSRLFRHRLQFDDYTDTELEHIFLSFCNRYGYRVTKAAHSKVSRGLQWCRQHDADLFANGRGVWRIFEEAVHHLARRIDGISPQTEELLTTLQNGDITFSGVPAHVLGTGAD